MDHKEGIVNECVDLASSPGLLPSWPAPSPSDIRRPGDKASVDHSIRVTTFHICPQASCAEISLDVGDSQTAD